MTLLKNLSSLFFILVVFTLVSCDDDINGPRITKDYDLVGFTKIDLGDALRLDIQVGSDFEIFAEGEEDDVNDLVLEVKNGTLISHYQPSNENRNNVKVFIKMPELTLAKLHSATKTTFNNAVFQEQILIELEGAAELDAKIKCEHLDLLVSGASEAKLNGEAELMHAEVRGASELFAQPFTTKKAEMEVSGKSEAIIMVEQELLGKVNGKSRLTFYGNPNVVDVEISSDSHLVKQ